MIYLLIYHHNSLDKYSILSLFYDFSQGYTLCKWVRIWTCDFFKEPTSKLFLFQYMILHCSQQTNQQTDIPFHLIHQNATQIIFEVLLYVQPCVRVLSILKTYYWVSISLCFRLCFQIVVLEKTLESPLTARRSN